MAFFCVYFKELNCYEVASIVSMIRRKSAHAWPERVVCETEFL